MGYWRELAEDVHTHVTKFKEKPVEEKSVRRFTIRINIKGGKKKKAAKTHKKSIKTAYKALGRIRIHVPVGARISKEELARRIRERLERPVPGKGYYAENPPKQRYL